MFCSKCGADAQRTNAYCTRCGEWLPDPKSLALLGRGANTPDQRLMTMVVFNALSAVFGLFSAIALYATYLGRDDARWSIYIAAGFCLVTAIYQSINFFYSLELRRRLRRGRESGAARPGLDERPAPRGLPDAPAELFVNRASVTDNTTELLEPALRRRAGE